MIELRLQINPTPLHETARRSSSPGKELQFNIPLRNPRCSPYLTGKSVEESEGKFKPNTCAICLTACGSSWRDELAGRAFQLDCISYLSWSLPLSAL
jgi:hypothetical protein